MTKIEIRKSAVKTARHSLRATLNVTGLLSHSRQTRHALHTASPSPVSVINSDCQATPTQSDNQTQNAARIPHMQSVAFLGEGGALEA